MFLKIRARDCVHAVKVCGYVDLPFHLTMEVNVLCVLVPFYNQDFRIEFSCAVRSTERSWEEITLCFSAEKVPYNIVIDINPTPT